MDPDEAAEIKSFPEEGETLAMENVVWLCNNCPALFRDEMQLTEHIHLSHEYICELCDSDQLFISKIDFLGHFYKMHAFHPIVPQKSEIGVQCERFAGKLKRCNYCKERYPDLLGLKRHYAEVHLADLEIPADQLETVKRESDGSLVADEASSMFVDGESVQVILKEGYDTNLANKSSELFGFQAELDDFQQEFEGDKFPCLMCQKLFRDVHRLETHIRQFHDVTICIDKLRCTENLPDFHMDLLSSLMSSPSSEDNLRRCPICGQSFKTSFQLYIHKRRQHVEPVTCNICHSQLKHKDSLEVHMRVVHSNAYRCTLCMFGTFNEDSLRQHVRNVHETPKRKKEVVIRASNYVVHMKEEGEVDCGAIGCIVCSKLFITVACLASHIRKYHDCHVYIAKLDNEPGISDFGPELRDALSKPVKQQRPMSKCAHCFKLFRSRESLHRHVQQYHGGPSSCRYCNRRFKNSASLDIHMAREHPESSKKKQSKVCCVPNCQYDLNDSVINVDYFRMADQNGLRQDFVVAVKNQNPSYRPRLRQLICKFHFSDDDIIDTESGPQLRVGAVPTLFVANPHTRLKREKLCKKNPWKRVVADEEKLGRSEDEIGRLERSCPICLQFFSDSKCFLNHLKLYHNMDPVPILFPKKFCEVCEEAIPVSVYEKHMRKHRDPPTLPCPKCEKMFYRKTTLSKHMKCCFREQKRICSFCGKEFHTEDGIKYHVANVHGVADKRFERATCTICGNVLKNMKLLHRHIKMIHLNHRSKKQCSLCGKQFTTKMGLEDHINAIHTKEYTYKCLKCHRCFTQRIQARKHNKMVHKLRVNCANMDEHIETMPWVDAYHPVKQQLPPPHIIIQDYPTNASLH